MTERLRKHKSVFMEWVDCHPRTGWYIAVVVTANFFLDLVTRLVS